MSELSGKVVRHVELATKINLGAASEQQTSDARIQQARARVVTKKQL